jgi:hypothetical protein
MEKRKKGVTEGSLGVADLQSNPLLEAAEGAFQAGILSKLVSLFLALFNSGRILQLGKLGFES